MKKMTLTILLLMLAATIISFGCGDDDDDDSYGPPRHVDPPYDDDDDSADDDDDDDVTDDDDSTTECDWSSHDPLIVLGKSALSDGDAVAAYESFDEALEVCNDSRDARMGILLADAQWFGNGLSYGFDSAKALASFQELVRDEFLPRSDDMKSLADELLDDEEEVRFFIEPLPMFVSGETVVLDMSGEWDRNDVTNLKAFGRLWEGIGQLVMAFNLDIDWAVFEQDTPEDTATTTEWIHYYSGVLLDVLADPAYPDFLTFADDGESKVEQAGVEIGLGLHEFVGSFDAMLLETDLQEDDVAGYVDANGNGQWDEGEFYHFAYFGDLNYDMNVLFADILAFIDDIGKSALDGGPEDLRPVLPDWFLLSDLNFVMEFLDLFTYGTRLPPIPIDIGKRFYDPPSDGMRSSALSIAQLLYNMTAP